MLRTVGAAASMSAMLGRAGIRHRLATWIAAVAAGVVVDPCAHRCRKGNGNFGITADVKGEVQASLLQA